MLNVPRLDDLDYNRLFEHAKSAIPTLTKDWTDLNYHDPGITTLQTFAWLYDSLNYYINATGEVHLLKYLKLLGIESRQAEAQCNIALEGAEDLYLPKGARFTAGHTVFEAAESFHRFSNRLTRLYCEVDGSMRNLTAFAGIDGGFAPLFTLDAQSSARAYFGFARPLAQDTRFYIELEEHGRTPFDERFSLAEFEWAFYDGTDWRPVQILSDETCGFLRSGYLSLYLEGETSLFEQGPLDCAYYLRCTLIKNELDALPRIGRVLPNCVRAVQKNTWTKVLEFQYDGSGLLPIDYGIRQTDLITVAVKRDGWYEEWYRHTPNSTDLCAVAVGERPWQRTILFDAARFGTAPSRGNEIVVFILSDAAAPAALLGTTDGCSGQRLGLDAENISALRLALAKEGRDGRLLYQLWEPCEDLSCAGYDDYVFYFDANAHQIVFGDSLHGFQPESGWSVWAVDAQTSLFDGGNVLAGQITALSDPISGISGVYNPAAASGGRRRQSARELEAQIDLKMNAVTRAVTSADYEALVRQTPGLMIDSVAVIPMKDYYAFYHCAYQANTVLIAVKPRCAERLPGLSAPYQRAILSYFERYRLLTTDVRIIPVHYVGVSVYGRLILRENSLQARALVEQRLRQLIETLSTGAFGRGVDYGKLFSQLELTDGVKNVAQLSLEYIGYGGKKNEHGDIVVGPDSLCYLRETGIEYS